MNKRKQVRERAKRRKFFKKVIFDLTEKLGNEIEGSSKNRDIEMKLNYYKNQLKRL